MANERDWFKQVEVFAWLAGWAVVGSGWVPLYAQSKAGPGTPHTLRCEYMDEPLGVDTTEPRFAWVLQHTERAETQTAYQVLVATRTELLNQDRGDQWDSGKVASDDFTQVAYAGKPLDSGRSYYWKVRYWDKEGRASAYSQPARFGTALLKSSNWKASWIAPASRAANSAKSSPCRASWRMRAFTSPRWATTSFA